MAAHGAQLGQVELQPDHEHEKHHTELAEMAHAGRVLSQPERVGADDHAHHQVTQHGRQLQRTAGYHAEHRGQQVKKREFEAGHPAMVADGFDTCAVYGMALDRMSP